MSISVFYVDIYFSIILYNYIYIFLFLFFLLGVDWLVVGLLRDCLTASSLAVLSILSLTPLP